MRRAINMSRQWILEAPPVERPDSHRQASGWSAWPFFAGHLPQSRPEKRYNPFHITR